MFLLFSCSPSSEAYHHAKEAKSSIENMEAPFDPIAFPGDLSSQDPSGWSAVDQPFQIFAGSGVIAGDFNGDGWEDLFLTKVGYDEFYLGAPDRHFIRADEWLPHGEALSVGGAAADYDGDGDLDVYVAVSKGEDYLLRNEGDSFVDATFEAEVVRFYEDQPLENEFQNDSACAEWGDYDGDGDLDLVVCGTRDFYYNIEPEDLPVPATSLLFQNQGQGVFKKYPIYSFNKKPMACAFSSVQTVAGEQPLLYMVNDSKTASFGHDVYNHLFSWNGDEFESHGPDSGLQVLLAGMGMDLTELNGDFIPDIFVSDIGIPSLFVSLSEDSWYDGALSLNIGDLYSKQTISWGPLFGDFENDGDQDLWLAFGPIPNHLGVQENHPEQPDAWFVNDEGSFKQYTKEWDFRDNNISRGGVLFDFDHDGRLDLVRASLNGPVGVYWGNTDVGEDNHWLTVSLEQSGSNRFALGARIDLYIEDHVQTQWIRSAVATGSSRPPTVHFGIGEAEEIDELHIYWPDGDLDIYTALEPDQHLRLTKD